MPTILIENGFRLFFYSDERNEFPHVHVKYQGGVAKYWIQPFSLASNAGLSGPEVRKASLLAQKHQQLILEKWNAFFGKKS